MICILFSTAFFCAVSKGNAPITPKAKVHENAQPAPNTVSTSTSLPDDFNYEDSDSITGTEFFLLGGINVLTNCSYLPYGGI